jgi:hypothetical protein
MLLLLELELVELSVLRIYCAMVSKSQYLRGTPRLEEYGKRTSA